MGANFVQKKNYFPPLLSIKSAHTQTFSNVAQTYLSYITPIVFIITIIILFRIHFCTLFFPSFRFSMQKHFNCAGLAGGNFNISTKIEEQNCFYFWREI